MTYTYVVMGVSKKAFKEIEKKLKEAGYDHALHASDGELLLDMHGIALKETNDD